METIGGSINSFLENFAGRDKDDARLALYRLWLGKEIDKMKCLTVAQGDGKWGELGDAYFLAAGSKANLNTVFTKVEPKFGKPTMGGGKNGGHEKLAPITDKPLSAELIAALEKVPKAKEIAGDKR